MIADEQDDPDDTEADDLQAAAAAFGLQIQGDISPPPSAGTFIDCLPDNIVPLLHWSALQTQWRHDFMGHLVGLDYAGVCAYLGAHGYHPNSPDPMRLSVMLDDIRCMERATLDAQATQRASRGDVQ